MVRIGKVSLVFPVLQAIGGLDEVTESEEYRTAMEKSATLYDRVRALRNAAAEKLESIRSESAASQYHTAAADVPMSDYARSKYELRSDDNTATCRYTTGEQQKSSLVKSVNDINHIT